MRPGHLAIRKRQHISRASSSCSSVIHTSGCVSTETQRRFPAPNNSGRGAASASQRQECVLNQSNLRIILGTLLVDHSLAL
eukprot:m.418680 g.418680  ORF g.418680 m.418680 type:complete len:81 (-) comp31075_c0_seq1:745-987(-)